MAKNSLSLYSQPGGLQSVVDERLVPNNVWYVDSTSDNNGSTSGYGSEPDKPFDLLASAADSGSLAAGDLVIVRPGHVEDIGPAAVSGQPIDLDTAGITVVGQGVGSKRPRFDFDNATSAFGFGANDVRIANLVFRPSAATVAIGVNIEAGVTGCVIEDCEFANGEAGDSTDEFVLGVDLKAGCDGTIIRNNTFRTHASAGGATHAVKLTGASDNVVIEDNVMRGQFGTACIGGDTTLSTNVLIQDNLLQPTDGQPGIEMLGNTTGIIRRNHIATDLATMAAAIVCAAAYLFDNLYCEVITETGGLIGTESADDT